MSSSGIRLAAAVFATALFTSACVTPPPHPYRLAPGHEGAATVEKVMVLPLNVVVALPAELQEPAGRVSSLIADYLRASGKEVESIGLYAARDLWVSAVRKAKASPDVEQDFDAVAPTFVRFLHDQHRFDALVMPSLVYRSARIVQGSRSVVWDGVKRELEIVNEEHMHMSVYLASNPSGTMRGVSLHLLVFGAEGERLFESYGGMDLVDQADLGGSFEAKAFQMRVKNYRLTDEIALREGITVAFDPYLPPLPLPEAGDEGS
jgi:hypothetical protein